MIMTYFSSSANSVAKMLHRAGCCPELRTNRSKESSLPASLK